MSSPEFSLELSERAILDFRDILSHTLQQWGERQLVVYRDVIDQALAAIERYPHSGRRLDKSQEILVFPVGKHQIFYRIYGIRIVVLRILHWRMNSAFHVNE